MSKEINLYVNSYFDNLPSDTSSKWTTYLAQPITGYSKMTMRVENIELPNVSNNFAFFTSRLWYLYEADSDIEELRYIEINFDRVYNSPEELVNELNSRFLNDNGDVIEVSYDPQRVRLTFTNNTPVPIRFISSFRHDDLLDETFNHINDKLGLTQPLQNQIIQSGGSLTGESMLRLIRTNCYYISCNLLANGGNISTFQVPNPDKRPKILAKVTSGNFGTLSQLQYTTDVDLDVSDQTLSRIDFEILDDEFEPIQLNGHPTTFTLRITLS